MVWNKCLLFGCRPHNTVVVEYLTCYFMENNIKVTVYISPYYITMPSISNGLLSGSGYGEKLPCPVQLVANYVYFTTVFIVS